MYSFTCRIWGNSKESKLEMGHTGKVNEILSCHSCFPCSVPFMPLFLPQSVTVTLYLMCGHENQEYPKCLMTAA